jgi:hypothetical protein
VDGPNLYLYVGGSPVRKTDPDGRQERENPAQPAQAVAPAAVSGTDGPAAAPSTLTPAEKAAWDAVEAAGYSDESVEKLIETFVEPRITNGLLNKDVAERYATVRGSAFAHHFKHGNYGRAAGNLTGALVESFGAALFGSSPGETTRNVVLMYLFGAAVGGTANVSRSIASRPSRYTPLSERSPAPQPAPAPAPAEPAAPAAPAAAEAAPAETLYGPFYRANSLEVCEAMVKSGELGGRGVFANDRVISAQAYTAEGIKGKPFPILEFFTTTKPGNASGTIATWAVERNIFYELVPKPGIRMGTIEGKDAAFIPICRARVITE